jgi:hypothetical protein
MIGLPFLTAYDPPGSSEGALDPLGLFLIAERLATQLVPAVRERMQRIRFLTAIAVGCFVTEDIVNESSTLDVPPYLVWEWLLVEAFYRTHKGSADVWGVPGTLVTSRAMEQFGYLDSRSYLKNARIFGFHGVYKRLAYHLGIVNVDLGPGPLTDQLVDGWAKALGYAGLKEVRPLIRRWSSAVRSCVTAKPHAKTVPGFNGAEWETLANSFLPGKCRGQEKELLRNLLLATNDRLGALPVIWKLQSQFRDDDYCEEALHSAISASATDLRPLIKAIGSYESFARSLQDAFDLVRAEASKQDCVGYPIAAIAKDSDFKLAVSKLEEHFNSTLQEFGNLDGVGSSLQVQFADRFKVFASKQSAESYASALCEHHAIIQRAKSEQGKRTWFDRLDADRIHIRHAYRINRQELKPDKYVHDYRGGPIRNFRWDLDAWGDAA